MLDGSSINKIEPCIHLLKNTFYVDFDIRHETKKIPVLEHHSNRIPQECGAEMETTYNYFLSSKERVVYF